MQRWAQHLLVGTEWGCHLHNTETGSPLCHLYLFRLRHRLRCLDDEKRLFLLFVSIPIFSPTSSSAYPRYTEVGFLMGLAVQGMIIISPSAGYLHLLVLVRINKDLLNDLKLLELDQLFI